MSRKARAIWKAAFQRDIAHLPQCPPIVTEPQWAFMLFGPGICVVSASDAVPKDWPQAPNCVFQACEKYGALADFAFLKQYCQRCMVS